MRIAASPFAHVSVLRAAPEARRPARSIVALRGSVPSAWVSQFRQTQGKLARVYFAQRAQLAALFAELRAGGGGANSAANADAVTVGDSWLGQAVAGGLIAPIPRAEASRWLARLPPRWAPLLRRRACDGACCPDAPVWGVPYRWGCVLFAVRTDRAATAGVADWADLLRPELARRVAAPDAPRLLLSAALRSLGVSANCAGLGALAAAGASAAQLRDRLAALRRQLLTQHAEQHLQALAAGDAWVAIGSSADLLPFAMRTPGVTVVAPASGTLLWADLWALPASRAADPSPLLRQWHEFTTQPARADAAAGLKPGASPLLLPPAAPADAHSGPPPACFADLERGVWPRRAVLERSEFMLPLPPAAQDEFAALMAAA